MSRQLSEKELEQRRTAALKTGKYAKAKKEYYATEAFFYGDRELAEGEVIALEGFKNDNKLVFLGFLKLVPVGFGLSSCELCGRKFYSKFYAKLLKSVNDRK